jgi:hypothetical protein
VPGIVAPLEANHPIRVFRKYIDDFSFALVTPLGTDQDRIGHVSTPYPHLFNGCRTISRKRQGAHPMMAGLLSELVN